MLFSLMGAVIPSVASIPAREMMLMIVNNVMVRNIPTTVAIVYLIKLFILCIDVLFVFPLLCIRRTFNAQNYIFLTNFSTLANKKSFQRIVLSFVKAGKKESRSPALSRGSVPFWNILPWGRDLRPKHTDDMPLQIGHLP
jgi:hypothetical protein